MIIIVSFKEVIISGAFEKMAEASDKEEVFTNFMKEVKTIEKQDAVLTGPQQIDRLLRPAAKYGNLNPYEVLMISIDMTEERLRKQYRKMSFLVHPDKNQDDKERAQTAFEAVNKAYKMLQDEEQLKYCQSIVDEAKGMTELKLQDKRKQAKKQGRDKIEEDSQPELVEQMVRNTMTKLFADYEIKKIRMAEREVNERKRERVEQDTLLEKVKRDKEWKQKWDATRGDRVTSWRDFQTKGKKKSKAVGLKPPKNKQEKR